MEQNYPFGSPLRKVEQLDKTPKKVFVLGNYGSAVHAKWIDINGRVKVNALAVASEPNIFWKGDGAREIIDKIKIPSPLGTLIPADERFNGPSGNVLDDLFLNPLGYSREDAWLCDLLPYSRINPDQQKAIERCYNPLMKDFDLPECTILQFSLSELNNPSRINEIVAELEQSQADTIILLGDLPIRYFLSHFANCKKLSDFGKLPDDYGKTHKVNIADKIYKVIPLVHPRQAGSLGRSSSYWKECHDIWVLDQVCMIAAKLIEKKDPSKVVEKPKICPFCQSKNIASYLYGMPIFSKKLQKDIDEGKIILKGCIVSDDDPDYVCNDCNTEFYKI